MLWSEGVSIDTPSFVLRVYLLSFSLPFLLTAQGAYATMNISRAVITIRSRGGRVVQGLIAFVNYAISNIYLHNRKSHFIFAA